MSVKQLSGDGLDAAKAFHEASETFASEQAYLVKTYKENLRALIDKTNAKSKEAWARIATSLGLDPDTSYGNYRIETGYLDFDVAFVIENPPEPKLDDFLVSDAKKGLN